MTQLPTFTRKQLETLDKSSLITLIVEMQEQMAARIQALEDQIAKTSQNSSKPPSSDGLKKKPAPRSLREKGKRKSGGQQGHKGKTLEMVADPDHIQVHSVAVCPDCETDLGQLGVQRVEKRQVFDVPPLTIEVTEHQAEVKCCPLCQAEVKAAFPAAVSQPVQYGERLKAQAVYLNTYQLLPLARICELFGDWYGHTPSQALILNANQTVREQVKPTLHAIRRQLLEQAVMHCDESGMRVEGQLNWLHVMATAGLTYYAVHRKRGQEALGDIDILTRFTGRAIHDGWASYFLFKTGTHALCNAHHLRELRFIHEQYRQAWAAKLFALLLDIKDEVKATCPEQMSLPRDRLQHYSQRYDDLLRQGFDANPAPPPLRVKKRGRRQQSPPKNLLDRLQKYKAETLTFMSDFRVPFDNNLAERDVRMMKVKQKISGTFRTRIGAETFCDIRSYISTVRKQGGPVIQALHDALLERPFMPT